MSFNKYKERGAYHYGWYETEPWYKLCVDRVVEFCKGSTLDVGCGDGLVARRIADTGLRFIRGIDSDETAIALARQNDGGWEDLYFDVHDLNRDLPDESKYSYMACLNVIEHLPDPKGLVRLFNQTITKAGIIITDYPQENPSSHHVREYTPAELADLFKEWRVVPFKINDDFHGVEVYK
jgi:2-polyprenyl-3-methyl-5-hydroxy-6-metoxy-1,4-benzoquinol methylase